jgi:hypothetical protein
MITLPLLCPPAIIDFVASPAPTKTRVNPKSEAEIRKAVGAANVRYYDRMNSLGLGIGCATPIVLFAVLCFVMTWKLALPVAIAAFLG